ELLAVHGIAVPLLVELRRVLDLVLRAVHEDRLGVRVDVPEHAGREHYLLAEDPHAGIDDDEAAAGLVGRFVHLADAAVGGLDLEAGQIEVRRHAGGESPHLNSCHSVAPPRVRASLWPTPRSTSKPAKNRLI